MSLHRFIIDRPLQAGRMNLTNTDVIHQITRVLRLEAGQPLILADGAGLEARATVVRHDTHGVLLTVEAVEASQTEPHRPVFLYCALLKRQNFELVAQKATELGVHTLIPLESERTVKHGLRRERLLSIIREAAEQSGRGRLPELAAPMRVADAFANPATPACKLWWQPNGKPWQPSLLPGTPEAVSLWIGPEGGWTAEENSAATSVGATLVSFGPRILRAETAAIVATALVTCQEG